MCVQEVLLEQRKALSDTLQQLMKQRDQREQELRQVLVSTHLVLVVLGCSCVCEQLMFHSFTLISEYIILRMI